MVCPQSTLWRTDCKMESSEERAFNKAIAGTDDTARPGSSCLHAMEDRQIIIDQLAACDLEVLIALWDLEQFYDPIPFTLIRSELKACQYPVAAIARIRMQHGSPMWIKGFGSYSEITRPRGNGAVSRCHKSNAIARAVTLIGPDDLREFTKTNLGCNNSLLPKYLEALEEAQPVPSSSDHSSSRGDNTSGGHELANGSVPPLSTASAPFSTSQHTSAQAAMARGYGNTKGVIAHHSVDDMVNIMWSRSNLHKISYATCKKWCR